MDEQHKAEPAARTRSASARASTLKAPPAKATSLRARAEPSALSGIGPPGPSGEMSDVVKAVVWNQRRHPDLPPDYRPWDFALDSEGYSTGDGRPMPTELHSRLGNQLTACLDDHLRHRFGDRAAVINDVNVYPVEGQRNYYLLPDLFVILDAAGRPRPEDRDDEDYERHRCYKLWQEPPIAFVLEIISPTTGRRDIEVKPALYEAMGVSEYWVFDARRRLVPEGLRCWRLVEDSYQPVALEPPPKGVGMPPATSLGTFSKELGLYFCIEGKWLWPYDPETGKVPTLEDRREQQEAMARQQEAMASRMAELEAELARLRKSP